MISCRHLKKSSAAQSELFLAVIFMGLVSGAVIAQNVTNITNFTGDVIRDIVGNEAVQAVAEANASIEIWARTALELAPDKLVYYENETLEIRTSLYLDNGTAVAGAPIQFYIDGLLIGIEATGGSGRAVRSQALEGMAGRHEISVIFDSEGFMQDSSEFGTIEVLPSEDTFLAETIEVPGITYDSETDTIMITGSPDRFTESAPCTLTDIYNADKAGGWNQVTNLYNYFTFDAKLQIGDAESSAHLYSQLEHVYITKPWEVMPGSSLVFGYISDSGEPFGGVMFEANVSERDQLAGSYAIRVNRGASLRFYESVYKVFGDAENNIQLASGSSFDANRFDIQRLDKSEGKTRLVLPEDSDVVDFFERDYVPLECADQEMCREIREASE